MINTFLNFTDNFLCNNLKKIVDDIETRYRTKGLALDLPKELERLDEDAFVSRNLNRSDFEKQVKFNIKVLIGIFFVAVPLITFASISYLLDAHYSYAFVLTFIVALFSSVRMENIVHRYTQLRYSALAC